MVVTSIDLNRAVKLPLPNPPQPPACSIWMRPSAPSTCTREAAASQAKT